MLESIALGLLKTLASYMLKYYLNSTVGVKIDGAPSWFHKQDKGRICVFTYSQGSMASIDIAKNNAKGKMSKKINELIEIVIYDKYRDLRDPKEIELVNAFKKDELLPVFVNRSLKFRKIEYKKRNATAFVKACIDNEVIQEYQKERMKKIVYQVSHKRASNAFDELDKDTGNGKKNSKDPFKELENE